jgi:hypothetical protein
MTPLAFNGARLEADWEGWRATLGGGKTTVSNLPSNFVSPFQSATQSDMGFAGLSLSRRLWQRSQIRLAHSRYLSDIGPSNLVSGEFSLGGLGTWDLSGAYGLELERPGQRAYRWDFRWNEPWLQLSGAAQSQSPEYGPAHPENFARGNQQVQLEARLPLSDQLQLSQGFRYFSLRSPALEGLNSFGLDTSLWDTQLLWTPDRDRRGLLQ